MRPDQPGRQLTLAATSPGDCGLRRQAEVGQAGVQALDLHGEEAVGLLGWPVQAEPAQHRQLAADRVPLDAIIGVAELVRHRQ